VEVCEPYFIYQSNKVTSFTIGNIFQVVGVTATVAEAVVFPILVSATIGRVVAARAGPAADFRTMAMIEV